MGAWQDMIYDPKRTGQVDEPGWPDRASTVQVKQERDSRCGRRDTTAGTEEDDPEDEQGRDEEADRGGEEDRSTEADEEEGDGSDDDEEESESDARPATGKAKPGASARAGKQQRQKGSAVRTSTRAAPRASSTAKRKRAKDEDSSEESEAEERVSHDHIRSMAPWRRDRPSDPGPSPPYVGTNSSLRSRGERSDGDERFAWRTLDIRNKERIARQKRRLPPSERRL